MTDTTTVTVTRETLEATPERVMTFLRGVARKAAIRARLQRRGYDQEAHDQGFAMLKEVAAYTSPTPIAEDGEVRSAMAELNSSDEDILTIVDVTLRYQHPAVHTKLLAGLTASRDEAEAVVTLGVLTQRLDELERSGDSEGKQALDRLAKRGIDGIERKRLEALIEAAGRVHEVKLVDQSAVEAAEAAYLENLRRLRAWYEEWSGVARASIKRRDHRILLGLAQRRSPGTATNSEDDDIEPNTI